MKYLLFFAAAITLLGGVSGCVAARISKAYVVNTEQHPKIAAGFIQSLKARAISEREFSVDGRFAAQPNLALRKVILYNGGRFEIWLGIERKADVTRIWVSYDPQLARSSEIEQVMQFIAKELEAWGAYDVPIETSSTPFV